MNFGFSEEKYQKKIDHYRKSHETAENVDEVVKKYEQKLKGFVDWFIEEERQAVLNILRNITQEFTMGNSIYPSDGPAKIDEFNERRLHIDRCIGYCYSLKQELNYVIGVLPVDMNKYERFEEMITLQIALFKGVRTADNRFLKERQPNNGKHKNKRVESSDDRHQSNPVSSDVPVSTAVPSQPENIAPTDVSKIPSYQQVKTNQNNRVPNTSKMNLSQFQQPVTGVIQDVLPGQPPPFGLHTNPR